MKFKTLIKHTPGTVIDVAGRRFKLDLDESGHAVIETSDAAAIKRLLQIPEGFEVVIDEPEGDEKDAAVDLVAQRPASELVQLQGVNGAASEGESSEASDADESTEGQQPSFVLTNGEKTLDLGTLDDDALRAFVAENDLKGISTRLKGNALRAAIVKTLAIK